MMTFTAVSEYVTSHTDQRREEAAAARRSRPDRLAWRNGRRGAGSQVLRSALVALITRLHP